MTILEEIIDSAIKERIAKETEMIEQSFQECFGFPISMVKERGVLEHIIQEGTPIESYRYKGVTFLYKERGVPVFEQDRCTITDKYKPVKY